MVLVNGYGSGVGVGLGLGVGVMVGVGLGLGVGLGVGVMVGVGLGTVVGAGLAESGESSVLEWDGASGISVTGSPIERADSDVESALARNPPESVTIKKQIQPQKTEIMRYFRCFIKTS